MHYFLILIVYILFKQAIEDFLVFLQDWKNYCQSNKIKFPISASTFNGLRITLKATLEILEYVITELHYDFLLTARLNQDALEVSISFY